MKQKTLRECALGAKKKHVANDRARCPNVPPRTFFTSFERKKNRKIQVFHEVEKRKTLFSDRLKNLYEQGKIKGS